MCQRGHKSRSGGEKGREMKKKAGARERGGIKGLITTGGLCQVVAGGWFEKSSGGLG